MPDRPFISTELDRRIAVMKRARDAGQMDARAANRALMPWAAAEAWLVGHQGDAISPRDGQTPAGELCPLDATIGELTRARDTLARQIDEERKADRMPRYIGLRDAVRRLTLMQLLREGFRQKPAPPVPMPRTAQSSNILAPSQPSLLADMFGPDGKPLPIERNAA
jgi:hypothetical protein